MFYLRFLCLRDRRFKCKDEDATNVREPVVGDENPLLEHTSWIFLQWTLSILLRVRLADDIPSKLKGLKYWLKTPIADPLFADYLDAWCHQAQNWRTFHSQWPSSMRVYCPCYGVQLAFLLQLFLVVVVALRPWMLALEAASYVWSKNVLDEMPTCDTLIPGEKLPSKLGVYFCLWGTILVQVEMNVYPLW